MADATLPAGWTRHHHRESGVDFYVHEASGETQWQPPADDGLAPGWHAVVDEATGETYYAHAETHETSWAKPRSGWAKVTSGDDVYYAHRGTEETTWERPPGYESPAEDGAIDAAADAPPADAPAPPRGADVGDGWHRVLDPETQEHYYAHRESLVVQWEPPTEGNFSPGMRAAFNGHDGDAADDDAAAAPDDDDDAAPLDPPDRRAAPRRSRRSRAPRTSARERDDDGLSIADSLFDHRGSLVFQWDEDDVEAADDARWRKRQARQRALEARRPDPATGAVLDARAVRGAGGARGAAGAARGRRHRRC
ncbi:hypothetical protein JL722_11182 [Aureococcus anophagefferens]|nr:hypothetical protein JL722_11182 [Aureococcus anophagefferens]